MLLKTTEKAYFKEIYPQIYKSILPLLGKRPGPCNVYLFTGDNPSLLDTGSAYSLPALQYAFFSQGIKYEDINQIVLSHGHIDHYGSAKLIQNLSSKKIKVLAHADDQSKIEHGTEYSNDTLAKFLATMGVPLPFRGIMLPGNRLILKLIEFCSIDQKLNDGDIIKLGNYDAKIISTPGHTQGSIAIHLESEGILFSGDHILEHITPNAIISLDNNTIIPSRSSQTEFFSSIEKVEKINPSIIYTGHGKEIYDLKKTSTMYRNDFIKRQSRILDIISKKKLSIYEIARELFPHLGGITIFLDIFLSVSEVFTHLQVLQTQEKLNSFSENNILYFKRI